MAGFWGVAPAKYLHYVFIAIFIRSMATAAVISYSNRTRARCATLEKTLYERLASRHEAHDAF